ncbi:MAG: hypothetical protein QXX12_06880, partial [Nanopusillaceae archaeon]
YDVGKPIVILNSTEEDILVRPGPLMAFAPGVIYGAISRAVKPVEEAPLHTTTTKEVVLLVTAVLVVVSGVIGYLLGRRR